MGFEVGVANHVVEGEWVWADNVTEIGVEHAAFNASLKPPRHEGYHGVCFATIAGEAADEIRAFTRFSAVPSDESSNDCAIEACDEYFDILRMRRDMTLGEIEERIMKRVRYLRVRQDVLNIDDRAKAKL